MSITDRSRRRVDEALAHLEHEHGSFPVVKKSWELREMWYDWTRSRTEAGALGGAGVWLVDDEGRVLFVRREAEDRWEEPGGKHEPGEALAETARRETCEEAGIEAHITGVAQAHRLSISCRPDPDQPVLVNVYVIFRGTPGGGTARPEEGEIAAVRWWDEHPPRLHYDELRAVPVPAAE